MIPSIVLIMRSSPSLVLHSCVSVVTMCHKYRVVSLIPLHVGKHVNVYSEKDF